MKEKKKKISTRRFFESSPRRCRDRGDRSSLLDFAASMSYRHGYGNQITVTPALHAIGPYPRAARDVIHV